MDKIAGIIPARGGSKGIPRKNLAELAGKPLIQYTIDAALESRVLDWIVLSTDDPEIAEMGKQGGAMVPFLRPANLATDTTPMVPVIEHAVNSMLGVGDCEAVMVLQPTSPLRQAKHIVEAVAKYRQGSADGVVSVCEVKEHPYDLVTFAEGEMRLAVGEASEGDRRQDFPEFYFVNGAMYLVRTSVLLNDHTLLPRRCDPYMMDRRYSMDVDSPLDLQLAELMLTPAITKGSAE